MSDNEVLAGSSSSEPGGRTSRATAATPTAEAIWLCPAVVALTGPEIAAALYAFSDLIDDVPEPTWQAVRDELSFLVARYGTAMIEGLADWIALSVADSVSVFISGIDVEQRHCPSADRLTWCQQQALLLLGAEAPRT